MINNRKIEARSRTKKKDVIKVFLFAIHYLWKFSKLQSIICILLRCFASFFEILNLAIVYPLLYLFLNESALEIDNIFLKINLSGINLRLLIFFLIFSLIINTFLRIFSYHYLSNFTHRASTKVAFSLTTNRFKRGKKNQSNFLSSEILNQLRDQILLLPSQVFMPAHLIISCLITLIPAIIFLIITAPGIIIYSITLMAGIYFILLNIIQPYVHLKGKSYDQFSVKTGKVLKEMSKGWRDIFLYSLDQKFSEIFTSRFTEMAKSRSFIVTFTYIPKIIVEGLIIALLLPILLLNNDPKLVPLFGLTLFSSLRLLPYCQQLYGSITIMTYSSQLIKKVKSNLSLNDEYKKIEPHSYNQNTKKLIKDFIILNDYPIKHKCFPYKINPISRESDKKLNLKIPFGSKILLTGSSGSGKSTLLDFIAGFNRGEQSIHIDKNINLNLNYLDQVSYATQSPFIFEGSLIENITLYDKKINKRKLKKILNILNLNSLMKDTNLQNKYNPESNILSGGESQRIAVARALYSNKPIIFLDEPTSALDEKTSKTFLEGLPEILMGRTLIITMHKYPKLDWIDAKIEVQKL